MTKPDKTFNEVDLDCRVEEEDEGFGVVTPEIIKPSIPLNRSMKGFDSESERAPMRVITQDNIGNSEQDYSGLNQIDLECNVADDDDDFSSSLITPKTTLKLDFGDEENDILFKDELKPKDINYIDDDDEEEVSAGELVLEDSSLEEAKKKKTQGEVEADYWKDLSKKHSKTNVKGAYNTSFHFSGNPAKEAEMFNNGFASDGSSSPFSQGLNSASAGDVGAAASGGDGGGMGEAVITSKRTQIQELYEDLLLITGFEVTPVKSDIYKLKDTLNTVPEKECQGKDELKNSLYPYIQDCFIYPLQSQTGEKFETCDDWCKWYTSDKEKEFPQYKKDIQYCDLIANRWNEI